MAKFKLRKKVTIGALGAEHDSMLENVFVDLGHLDSLMDTSDPHFLIVGRTGSGKTALIEKIKKRSEHVSTLDPEELSMQYLHSSTILKTIMQWGVNLEMFYKYLWRHVCILELIRMRYGDSGDVPSKIQQIFSFSGLFEGDQKRTKEISKSYLEKYGDQYWIKTDTRIKNITNEMEVKLKSDEKIAASLEVVGAGVIASSESASHALMNEKVEQEVIKRAQSIVSDYLIADLNRVVEMLEKHGFNDPQKRYYLVIDDLDKDWMPDDVLYLDLIKSLLHTVRDLNGKLRGAKIIVALRENIYHRVFKKASRHEPQREKWADVRIKLRWSKDDLIQLVDNRLGEVFRLQYTQGAPTLREILPTRRKKDSLDPVDYVLERTFMRPRDMIDFMNTCFEQADSISKMTWAILLKAEVEYSRRRMLAVVDEWKDSYYGLQATHCFLKRAKRMFVFDDFSDSDTDQILSHSLCEKCSWLKELQEGYLGNQMFLPEIKLEILNALYLVGVLGVKLSDSQPVVYSFDRPLSLEDKDIKTATFYIHKMFWAALGGKVEKKVNDTAA
jgi:hypothetical protein